MTQDTSWWERFENWSLGLGILFSALNLSLKWGFSAATINHWLVDYLLVKLYLGEIFLTLAVLAVIVRKIKTGGKLTEKRLLFFALIFFLLIFLSSLAEIPFVALYLYGQIGLIFVVAVIVREKLEKEKKWKNWLINSLNGLIFGESCLAIYQLLKQKNWLPYSFLGETNLKATHDLARGIFFDKSLILPYGTMAHPNILAGTTVILLWWLWRQTNFGKWWQKIVLGLGLLILILTQSLAAGVFAIGLVISAIVDRQLNQQKLLEKKSLNIWQGAILLIIIILIPLLIARAAQLLPENDSLVRRAHLNQAAFSMWQKNPIFGVGLGQFTANLEQFWPNNQFTQPVHNIFLLFLAENGLFGVVFWIFFWKKSQKFKLTKDKQVINDFNNLLILSFWIIFLSLDHYLITSFWGLLVWLVFV